MESSTLASGFREVCGDDKIWIRSGKAEEAGRPPEQLLQGPIASGSTKTVIGRYEHVWTLENFSFFCRRCDYPSSLRSCQFDLDSYPPSSWVIVCTPEDRIKWPERAGCAPPRECSGMTLKLQRVGGDEPATVDCTFSLFDGNGKEIKDINCYYKHFCCVERPHYNLHSILYSLAPCGSLIIRVDVLFVALQHGVASPDVEPSSLVSERGLQASLVEDLQRLFVNEEHTDVVFKVRTQGAAGQKHFSAHRAILSVRSPVFAAMFAHGTRESQTGVVEITDFDENTVKAMLLYVYTGKVADNCCWIGIYKAADKYGLNELKALARRRMFFGMTAAGVLDVMQLANLHEDDELKARAEEFVRRNIAQVIDKVDLAEMLSASLVVKANGTRSEETDGRPNS